VMPYGNANTSVTNGRMIAYSADPTNGTLQVLWDSQAAGFPFIFNKFGSIVISGSKVFYATYDDQVIALSLA
jgi:6-phosphogluconolactonase (cycloisomerase 2 family)